MWISIDKNRVAKIEENGKLIIIKPTNVTHAAPIFCPVCEAPMKTSEDSFAFRQHQCCHFCALDWAQSEFYKWKEGWRPDEAQIKNAKERRKLSFLKEIVIV